MQCHTAKDGIGSSSFLVYKEANTSIFSGPRSIFLLTGMSYVNSTKTHPLKIINTIMVIHIHVMIFLSFIVSPQVKSTYITSFGHIYRRCLVFQPLSFTFNMSYPLFVAYVISQLRSISSALFRVVSVMFVPPMMRANSFFLPSRSKGVTVV